MSFGVPLPESELEFPSYPHHPRQGRENAFSATIAFGWLLCGAGLASVAFFLQADEEAVQRRLEGLAHPPAASDDHLSL